MSYLPFHDISQYQGNYAMSADPNPIIFIKMSGGDNGLYYDSRATANYYNATNAGKAVGMYHFAGGTDPIAEADFFIRACSPLAENDVLVLDWEVGHADPVGWCTAFVNHVHEQTGIWPLVYMNMSTANAHDWAPVFNNCGYWCAAPSFGFDDTLPVKYPQVAQQGPIVDGVDTNAWFGSLDQFKAYGYHAPTQPAPESAPQPEPQPQPGPTTPPVVTPPEEQPTPPPSVNVSALLVRSLKTFVQAFLGAVLVGLPGAVSIPTMKALAVGAFAAAVSAVMNIAIQPQEAR